MNSWLKISTQKVVVNLIKSETVKNNNILEIESSSIIIEVPRYGMTHNEKLAIVMKKSLTEFAEKTNDS